MLSKLSGASRGVFVRTVAFPATSTGVYRFPLGLAIRIAVAELGQFLERNSSPETVTCVCFGQETLRTYLKEVPNFGTGAGRNHA